MQPSLSKVLNLIEVMHFIEHGIYPPAPCAVKSLSGEDEGSLSQLAQIEAIRLFMKDVSIDSIPPDNELKISFVGRYLGMEHESLDRLTEGYGKGQKPVWLQTIINCSQKGLM